MAFGRRQGNTRAMQRLLDGGAKTTAEIQGRRCSSGSLVELCGADVNAPDEDGTTALMHAAGLGLSQSCSAG
jgi:hypothetical protein